MRKHVIWVETTSVCDWWEKWRRGGGCSMLRCLRRRWSEWEAAMTIAKHCRRPLCSSRDSDRDSCRRIRDWAGDRTPVSVTAGTTTRISPAVTTTPATTWNSGFRWPSPPQCWPGACWNSETSCLPMSSGTPSSQFVGPLIIFSRLFLSPIGFSFR